MLTSAQRVSIHSGRRPQRITPVHLNLSIINVWEQKTYWFKKVQIALLYTEIPYVLRKQSLEYFNFDYFNSIEIELSAHYGKPLKIMPFLRTEAYCMTHVQKNCSTYVLEQTLELQKLWWGDLLGKPNQIKYPGEFRITYPAVLNSRMTSVRFVRLSFWTEIEIFEIKILKEHRIILKILLLYWTIVVQCRSGTNVEI